MPESESRFVENTAPRSKRSVRNAMLVAGAIAAVGIGIWFYAGSGQKSDASGKSAKGRPTTTVGATPVVRQDMPISLTAIGTVQPIVNATVRTQLAGVLLKVYFTEGQHVTRGTPLAQIDPRPYQLAVQQAQGNLAKDTATLNSARVDLRRYQVLLAQDSIARQLVDQQAATVHQLEGTLDADRASVGTARLNLNYTTVRAPEAGKVGLRAVDVGSYVTPGDANGIVVITQTDPIDVSFALPQQNIGRVQKAARGHALPVTILDQNNTTVVAHGQFRTFDNAIDATSGTVKAKARVENSDENLFPNEFVNVQLLVDTLQHALVVPVTAVRTGPSGPFVYTLTPDKIAHRVSVTIGPSDLAHTAILSGLKGDEVVIFEGADRIDDGSKVTTADAGNAHSGGGGHGQNARHRHQGGAAQ